MSMSVPYLSSATAFSRQRPAPSNSPPSTPDGKRAAAATKRENSDRKDDVELEMPNLRIQNLLPKGRLTLRHTCGKFRGQVSQFEKCIRCNHYRCLDVGPRMSRDAKRSAVVKIQKKNDRKVAVNVPMDRQTCSKLRQVDAYARRHRSILNVRSDLGYVYRDRLQATSASSSPKDVFASTEPFHNVLYRSMTGESGSVCSIEKIACTDFAPPEKRDRSRSLDSKIPCSSSKKRLTDRLSRNTSKQSKRWWQCKKWPKSAWMMLMLGLVIAMGSCTVLYAVLSPISQSATTSPNSIVSITEKEAAGARSVDLNGDTAAISSKEVIVGIMGVIVMGIMLIGVKLLLTKEKPNVKLASGEDDPKTAQEPDVEEEAEEKATTANEPICFPCQLEQDGCVCDEIYKLKASYQGKQEPSNDDVFVEARTGSHQDEQPSQVDRQ